MLTDLLARLQSAGYYEPGLVLSAAFRGLMLREIGEQRGTSMSLNAARQLAPSIGNGYFIDLLHDVSEPG